MQHQCSECKQSVESDATTCPHCGFSPKKEGALGRRVFSAIGWFLTATIVGAPLGIPMVVVSHLVEKNKQNKTVASV